MIKSLVREPYPVIGHLGLTWILDAYFDHFEASWIRIFFTNRQQRVRVGNEYSNWSNVTSGIPQGSILAWTRVIHNIHKRPPRSNRCKL